MNMADVKDLLETFNDSDLRIFDLKKADFELYLSKNEVDGRNATCCSAPAPAPVAPVAAPAPVTQAPVAPAQPVAEKEEAPDAPKAAEGKVITSPIVGVVYLQASPESAPYVKVGDTVSENDTVCIVEAMKMMNEVPAGVNGTVTEILCENEQVVGIGDPLFRVK